MQHVVEYSAQSCNQRPYTLWDKIYSFSLHLRSDFQYALSSKTELPIDKDEALKRTAHIQLQLKTCITSYAPFIVDWTDDACIQFPFNTDKCGRTAMFTTVNIGIYGCDLLDWFEVLKTDHMKTYHKKAGFSMWKQLFNRLHSECSTKVLLCDLYHIVNDTVGLLNDAQLYKEHEQSTSKNIKILFKLLKPNIYLF